MSTRPWFPFYPADFYLDTAHLSLEEQGAYIRLLAHAWMNDGVIPEDNKSRSRILGVHHHRGKLLWGVIAEYFDPYHGGYRNKRLDKELQKLQKLSEVRSKAAGKRWNANANAIAYTPTKKEKNIKKRKKVQPKTPPPDDYQIPDSVREFAARQGLPNGGWLEDQVAKCLDWHRAKGNEYSDWDAVCRTWLRNAKSFGQAPEPYSGKNWI